MDYATATRFTKLCYRVGIPVTISQDAFAALVSRYGEGHRAYHNLSHIDRMLGWLDTVGESHDAIELAIWFHDAIYEPLGSDNEERSAQFFRDALACHLAPALAETVERLILATDLKRARSESAEEKLMIDMDLSILGSSSEEYALYCDAIRKEYAVVPEEKFRAGRRGILLHFLSQQIYQTDDFQMLEERARSNIQHEIAMSDHDSVRRI